MLRPSVGDQAAPLRPGRPPARARRPARCRSRGCAGGRRAAPWSRSRPRTAPRSARPCARSPSVASAPAPASSAAPAVSIQPSSRTQPDRVLAALDRADPRLALDPLERLQRLGILLPGRRARHELQVVVRLRAPRRPRRPRGDRPGRLRQILEVVEEVRSHGGPPGCFRAAMHQPGLEPGSPAFKTVPLPIKVLVPDESRALRLVFGNRGNCVFPHNQNCCTVRAIVISGWRDRKG